VTQKEISNFNLLLISINVLEEIFKLIYVVTKQYYYI